MGVAAAQSTQPAQYPRPLGLLLTILRLGGIGINARFWISIALLSLILLFGILGPTVFGKRDPLRIVGGLYDPPSRTVWLGTDNFGRDVFAQLMYGTRTSLTIGLIAGATATAIGVAIGTVAGFRGGWVEEALMGITNVVITIPSIVILILLSIAVASRSILVMGLIIGITSWPWTARAVRAQTSSLRAREHLDIARLSGASTLSLILWDIIPYMFSYIFMAFVLQFASGILQEAALSLLGLGPSNTISLGIMLQWSLLWEAVRTGAWWAFFPPTLLLSVIAFALLLLQSSLDELFNPRLRRN
ncbi:ABC transporter permease [Thermomicrobium sp. 4228-Ro]|uniref:ABC transporter permease n=1 Tax=Thermomicrobium sp. 4228-Ro TaxID=2993937 RepID=UPI0022490982|nr:ABC transporter permease [Thermomicrobium sp. 4228-Ro]MCX2728588.1 ABC transporter permease [Thermomicrobium sp. 4228-Ro]